VLYRYCCGWMTSDVGIGSIFGPIGILQGGWLGGSRFVRNLRLLVGGDDVQTSSNLAAAS